MPELTERADPSMSKTFTTPTACQLREVTAAYVKPVAVADSWLARAKDKNSPLERRTSA
jgi:hypothetical protein